MKLELTGVVSNNGPRVEIDEYVPITVHWSTYESLRRAPRCLMIDAGGSTIELKLDAESGVVAECILVDARGVTRVDLPIALPPEIEDGIPVIEISDPADEESPGGVYLHENGLDIRLSEGLIERGVRAGGVIFGFSAQRQLLGVTVRLGAADLHQLGKVIL